MFNVFRRSDSGFWCYQEPLNEQLIYATKDREKLLHINKETEKYLRHPSLSKPYFYEFYVIADVVSKYFKKEFSYDHYFSDGAKEIAELKSYFSALKDNSRGQPVFQCCRTSGRVASLIDESDETHIFLWRNPWDQWFSYKKGFDANNLLIINAIDPPKFFVDLKRNLDLPGFHHKDTFVEYEAYSEFKLSPADSYTLFYGLWCHAMLEAAPNCDLSINIDRLSSSEVYRADILVSLNRLGFGGLDFSDCSVPIAVYGGTEGEFYLSIEQEVHQMLRACGYTEEQLEILIKLSDKRQLSLIDSLDPAHPDLRDAVRAREYLQDVENKLAVCQGKFVEAREDLRCADAKIIQAEAAVHQAQLNVSSAEKSAQTVMILNQQTQAKAEQAKIKAEQAEALAKEANMRAAQAEDSLKSCSQQLQHMSSSYSWKITAPLRKGKKFVRSLSVHRFLWQLKGFISKTVKAFQRRLIRLIDSRPGFRLKLISLSKLMGVYPFMKSFYIRCFRSRGVVTQLPTTNSRPLGIEGVNQLSPNAKDILFLLERAIKLRNHKV